MQPTSSHSGYIGRNIGPPIPYVPVCTSIMVLSEWQTRKAGWRREEWEAEEETSYKATMS